jgi:hypothetical protein
LKIKNEKLWGVGVHWQMGGLGRLTKNAGGGLSVAFDNSQKIQKLREPP